MMKLSLKLPLAFSLASLLLMGAALIGLYQLNQALNTYQVTVHAHYDTERAVARMLNQFKVQVQEWKNVLLRGKDPKKLELHWVAFQKNESAITGQASQLQAALSTLDPEASALIQKFAQAHVTMGTAYRKGFDAFKAAGFDATVGDKAVQGIDREPATLLDEASKKIAASSHAVATQAAESSQRASVVSLVLMLTVCVASLAGSLMFSRVVVRALQRAVDVSRAVANGDLTTAQPFTGKDEVAELLNSLYTMQSSLVQVVGYIRQSATSVANVSAEIAFASNDLSIRTEDTSSALQQASTSMEQLGSSVQINAEHTQQADQLAAAASKVAIQGGEVVGRVIDTMKSIDDASSRIADIIGAIDGIAFQTNILALNAAVEAARAGDQGRGFAIVASEVRHLALRSAEAAKEIKALVDTNVQRVQLGSTLVTQAGSTIQKVVLSIHQVNDIMDAISQANNEQSDGVSQIGQAVALIDQSTQKNVAIVEETASTADSLRIQAQEMVEKVSIFRLPEQLESQNHWARLSSASTA